MNPRTVGDLMNLLENYHQSRHDTYSHLADVSTDERTTMLLSHLKKLEASTLQVVRDEMKSGGDKHSTYLSSGPSLSLDPLHVADCHCDTDPNFQEALDCAWKSDAALTEVIDRLSGATAASSIQELATRLRELEETKIREIAKFTRED